MLYATYFIDYPLQIILVKKLHDVTEKVIEKIIVYTDYNLHQFQLSKKQNTNSNFGIRFGI